MSEGISLASVLIAAVASMLIGWIWYSPGVFGKAWMKAAGVTSDGDSKKGMGKVMFWQFIATLIMAFVLAAFIDSMDAATAAQGLQTGFMAWLGFVATTAVGQQLFEKKPASLFWISGGYYLVSMAVMGAILAMWS